jgi:hypothetical protein
MVAVPNSARLRCSCRGRLGTNLPLWPSMTKFQFLTPSPVPTPISIGSRRMARLFMFVAVLAALCASVSATAYFHESIHGSDTTCASSSIVRYMSWPNNTCQNTGVDSSLRFFCVPGSGSYGLKYWSFSTGNCTGTYSEVAPNPGCLNGGPFYVNVFCDDNMSATTAPTWTAGTYSNNQCSVRSDSEPAITEVPVGLCVADQGGSGSTMRFCFANRTVQTVSWSNNNCTGVETPEALVSSTCSISTPVDLILLSNFVALYS